MISLVSEFTYGTTVDAAQAANARDELRAHYLARSAVSLSRLLIKIQQRYIDPSMAQAKQMLQAGDGRLRVRTAGAAGGLGGMGALAFSLRITDYAGPLMGFFSGSKEEVASLGSLVGIDTGRHQGPGPQVAAASTRRSPPRTARSTSTAAAASHPIATARSRSSGC